MSERFDTFWILDDQHQATPVDLDTWARWFGPADRKVARTEIGTVLVSTVFLGSDHRFFGDGPPLIFETMTFAHGDEAGDCERCSTWAEALEQHETVCAAVRARNIDAEPREVAA